MQRLEPILVILFLVPFVACAQNAAKPTHPTQAHNMDSTTQTQPMRVEIWSDVLCPFCYIGKRKFEAALTQLPENQQIEVVWKSFQLDPHAHPAGNEDYLQNLADKKGWTRDYAKQATEQVSDMAAQVGLEYHFEKAVAANSFDAHRLTHMAHAQGLQNQAEESLFRAHFVEGKNVGDRATLVQIGAQIGLDSAAVQTMLASEQYADAVQKDITEARQVGVTGVPFFVFNRKYAVSGAQDTRVFADVLAKSLAEWRR